MAPALASLIFELLAGFLLVSILARCSRLLCPNWPLKLFLAVGIGWGLGSPVFFLCLLFGGSGSLLAFDLAALAAAIASWMVLRRSAEEHCCIPGPRVAESPILLLLLRSTFLASLGAGLTAFLAALVTAPHGRWDAWAIWNLRAKFLYAGTGRWRNAYSPEIRWSHSDYPLMLPSLVARAWTLAGGTHRILPAIIALAFTFGTVGLMFSALRAFRSSAQGLLAAIVLLSSRPWIALGAAEQADVPLGFLMLSTLVLIVWNDRRSSLGHDRQFVMVLAGIAASLAAWTKNEGLLFLFAVATARFATSLRCAGWRETRGEAVRFTAGALGMLTVLVYFKTVGSSRVDLQACKLEYSIVSPK